MNAREKELVSTMIDAMANAIQSQLSRHEDRIGGPCAFVLILRPQTGGEAFLTANVPATETRRLVKKFLEDWKLQ